MPDDPYLTPSQIRTRYTGSKVADDTIVSDEMLEEIIREYEETVEDHFGVAFVPRTFTDQVVATAGSGASLLLLPYGDVTSVTEVAYDESYGGTAPDVADLQVHDGWALVYPDAGVWPVTQRVTLSGIRGLTEMPQRVKSGCYEFVKHTALLRVSKQPRNATGPTDEAGYEFTSAVTEPTGVPKVDQILATVRVDRLPVIA